MSQPTQPHANFALPPLPFSSGVALKIAILGGSTKLDGFSSGERAAVLASWVSILRDKCTTSEEVVEVVCNLMSVALPGLATELTRCQTIKITAVGVNKDHYLNWLGIEDPEQGWVANKELPKLPRKPTDVATALTNPLNAYAGVSMVLYCLGKEITSVNSAAVTANRPRVVHDKYGLAEEDFKSAPDKPDGPSLDTLHQVYMAFGVMTEPRSVIIRGFLSLYTSGSHFSPEIDVVMVVFRLLDGAQMTHVSAIQDMIDAHPWLLKVPSLRPSIKEYISELRRFAQVPENIRGYIRLIEGNHRVFFPAPRMGPLVATAVELKTDIEGTFKNYMGGRNTYQHIIEEVRAYQKVYHMQKGIDSLATALGVPDVELPDVGAVFTPSSSAVVPPKV